MEQDQSSESPVAVESKKNSNTKWGVILLLTVVLLGSIFAWNYSRTKSITKKTTDEKQAEKIVNLAPNTVVYGFWVGSNSVVASVDLSTGKNNVLATLPSNIKHVKIVSANQLAFINKTDDKDYGKEIVMRTINNGSDAVVAKADEGYGIDDFALSPNGRYMATWEVSLPSNAKQLLGGGSKVYSIDLTSPGKKNLLYNEISSLGRPVNYPVAVTNGGDVYTDKFLPNSGAGWAYGMSMSNFTGTVKSEIATMKNGTYATQPVMSPDGTKLAFAGYDGTKGDGTADVNGYRRAVTIPNTVEVFDLATQQRTKLVSTVAEDIYPSVSWDLSNSSGSDGILFNTIAKNVANTGTYLYNLSTKSSKKVAIENVTAASSGTPSIQTALSGGSILVGNTAPSDSALGNLGGKYAPSLDSMYVVNSAGKSTQVVLGGNYVQFIGLQGAKFFVATNIPMPNGSVGQKNAQANQLQLQSFTIKPSLAPVRLAQQSGDRCRDVAAQQCNQLNGTSFSGDEALARVGQNNATGAISRCDYAGKPNTLGGSSGTCDEKKVTDQSVNAKAFDSCFQSTFANKTSLGACTDSPLYLYGKEGTAVNVSVGTPIFSPNASYNPEVGFAITLNKNGFVANGKSVDSLAFDYLPAIKKLSRPNYGVVVRGTELANSVREYAANLGLNQKETQDVVDYTSKEVASPFVYLSFYDNATSKQILPLYFDPQPETYHNIVFYFERLENKPNSQPSAPKFEKIVRNGFTAIEVSYIVK